MDHVLHKLMGGWQRSSTNMMPKQAMQKKQCQLVQTSQGHSGSQARNPRCSQTGRLQLRNLSSCYTQTSLSTACCQCCLAGPPKVLKAHHHVADEAQKAVTSAQFSAEVAYTHVQQRQLQQRLHHDWVLLIALATSCDEAGRLCLQHRPITSRLPQKTPN